MYLRTRVCVLFEKGNSKNNNPSVDENNYQNTRKQSGTILVCKYIYVNE